MPANLPPQYYEEEKKLKAARTPGEKLAALETLLSMVPKHKGTEKLQADLKRRLSKLRLQDGKQSGGTRKGDEYHVRKEGAGQVVLAGMPNAGKSQIVASLTKASPMVAEYPYSTLKPLSGMARFEDVQVQLVDIPPLFWEVTDTWVANILRNTDAICLVVELNDDPGGQVELLLEELQEKRIEPVPEGAVPGEGKAGFFPKRFFIAGTKLDLPGSGKGLEDLKSAFAATCPLVGLSPITGIHMDDFVREAFRVLDRVRVYSKSPGKKPDLNNPFVFPKGSTVKEMAGQIHKDFKASLKSARIFCEDKYNGQRVGKDFVLRDRDIIELVV